MKCKKIVLLIFLFFAKSELFSQQKANSNFTDGNGQSGQNSNVGNNLFNGTANVTIPIISNDVDGIKLGVELNYNTSGIRLDDVSSMIGLGWSLNYGGGITRILNGIPDEFYRNQQANQNGAFIGYWHRNNTSIPVGNLNTQVKPIVDDEAILSVANNASDGQMDKFVLSINGLQAEFQFNSENELIINPNNGKLRVERTIGGNPISVFPKGAETKEIGFIITDERGNKYVLKSGEKVKANTIAYSNGNPYNFPFQPLTEIVYPSPYQSYSGPVVEYYTTSWVLDYIETYNGKIVRFNYTPFEDFNIFSNRTELLTDVANPSTCFPYLIDEQNLLKSKISRIDNIVFPNMKIQFEYDPILRLDVTNAKALKDIVITENNNFSQWGNWGIIGVSTTSKRMRLGHSYFSTNGVKPYTSTYEGGLLIANAAHFDYRMKLDNISLVAPDGSIYKTIYNFDYYKVLEVGSTNPDDIPIDLTFSEQWPLRLNPSQDYWGYYNGNAATGGGQAMCIPYTNIPTPNFNYTGGYNRTPSAKNKLFSLKTITNEAKSVTRFNYGLHSAIVNGSPMFLDGLRLDEIQNYTEGLENHPKLITQYVYENGEWLLPEVNSLYPDINSFYTQNTNIFCPYIGTGLPPAYYANILMNIKQYTNNSMVPLQQQHGYGLVKTIMKKETKSKNLSNQIINTTEQLGETRNYFATVKSFPTSSFEFIGSTQSGATYTIPNTSLILPAPPSSTTNFNGYSFNTGSNYFNKYNALPFSPKNYLINQALGTNYKTETLNKNGQIVTQSIQKYKAYLHVYNTDNFLNLNASAGYEIGNNGTNNFRADVLHPDFYYPIVGKMELIQNDIKTYVNSSQYSATQIQYEYDNLGYPNITRHIYPNGTIQENREFYTHNNSNWSNNAIMQKFEQDNLTRMVYSEVWKKETGGNFRLVNASGGGFNIENSKLRDKFQYSLKGNTQLSTSPLSTGLYSVANANSGVSMNNFEKASEITKHDPIGNIIEVKTKEIYNSSIHDLYKDMAIAKVSNARCNEIAYSSFESNLYEVDEDNIPMYDHDKGNWLFPPAGIAFSNGITGDRCYNLGAPSTAPTVIEIKTAPYVELIVGKKYIVSFWKKNSGTVSIENWEMLSGTSGTYLATQAVPFATYTTNSSTISKLNNWTYCQAEFVASYKSLKITGGCLIDELRLYPANASMTTKCINERLGLVSECDAHNNIIHTESDSYQGISIIRDIHGNVLQKTKAVIQNSDF